MEVSFTKRDPIEVRSMEHVVVLAEMGFSKLDHYGRVQAGVSLEDLHRFADEVNRRDEPGTLHPRVRLSAIPRDSVRVSGDSDRTAECLTKILHALVANGIAPETVIVDLASPGLAANTRVAILAALAAWTDTHPAEIRRALIVDPA